MAFNRRKFLFGLGGAIVGLPFLEGLTARTARADDTTPPFAIFYRRGNGVQQAMFDRKPNAEPERWWPQVAYGAISQAQLQASASSESAIALELSAYASKLTIVRGLRHPVGTQNGHREGFIQGLTGAGVKYPNDIPDTFVCDPLGESLDNRIARELTPGSPTSLYMSVGAQDEGGVSFLTQRDAAGKQLTRAGEENLVALYNRLFLSNQTTDELARQLLVGRRKSVNDLVREELVALRNDKRLSSSDKARLQLHTDAIRDVENALSCALPPAMTGSVAGYQQVYDADPDWYKGHSVASFGAIVAKLAALSVACGVSRSVLVNMGPPQDTIQYREVTGAGGNDFHSISHRQSVDDDPSTNIPNAQLLHHAIDRFHLQLFRGMCDELAAYSYGDGTTLLDKGVCVHYSDIGSGQHEISQLPYLYVGGAGGALKTGLYQLAQDEYLVRFLNTIGAAVGCKNAGGGPLDDFNAANNGNLTGRISTLLG